MRKKQNYHKLPKTELPQINTNSFFTLSTFFFLFFFFSFLFYFLCLRNSFLCYFAFLRNEVEILCFAFIFFIFFCIVFSTTGFLCLISVFSDTSFCVWFLAIFAIIPILCNFLFFWFTFLLLIHFLDPVW